jgi:hypothetical protein
MKTRSWFAAVAVITCVGGAMACDVESEGEPRRAAVADGFADGLAETWHEGGEMITQVRVADDVVARAHWDVDGGIGWVETSTATLEVDLPVEEWTEHHANAFTYDLWRESRALIGTDEALRPEEDSFRSEADCSVSYGGCGCTAYISCSVCYAVEYGEHCEVLGSGPIPLPNCLCA